MLRSRPLGCLCLLLLAKRHSIATQTHCSERCCIGGKHLQVQDSLAGAQSLGHVRVLLSA